MAQFATAADLGNRLGITLTADEQTRANDLLTKASGIIQKAAQQTIELVNDDTFSCRSVYGDRIRLPERPVVSVSSVTLTLVGGAATLDVPSNTYYVDRDTLVRTAWPLAVQYAFAEYGRGWLGPLWQMQVVYSHGYADIPQFVTAICMEMVVRVWVNPGSVARETVGNTYTVYDNMRFSPAGLMLTDSEKQDISDFFRRHATTVGLR